MFIHKATYDEIQAQFFIIPVKDLKDFEIQDFCKSKIFSNLHKCIKRRS